MRCLLRVAAIRSEEGLSNADEVNRISGLSKIVDDGFRIATHYLAHKHRGKNSRIQNQVRKSKLKVGSVEHVFDYQNKIEDMRHAESQGDRFSKKGRSNLGHHFVTQAPDDYDFIGAVGQGSVLCVSIRQFCNDSKQDFEHSLILMDAAISLFHQACPFVYEIHGSKDGAVNFGFGFNLAYPRVCEKYGICAGIIDTPETAEGKDEEDQDFRQVQCALRLYVNSGNDVISAEDCCDAADNLQGAEKGMMNVVMTIKRGVGPEKLQKEKFIDGRLYRYHHQHDAGGRYTGTIVHRYAGIGSTGRLYTRADIDNFWPTLHKVSALQYTVQRSSLSERQQAEGRGALILSRKRHGAE